jgi:hypothetical protein
MELSSDIHKLVRAAFLYFIVVFAIAFVLGTIRVLVVVPKVGELVGVLIEVPILLTAAWIVSLRVIARTHVPHKFGPRLIVSGCAFLFLVSAEFGLSTWLFGNSPAAFFASFRTLHGAIGLAGQVTFAMLPIVQLFVRQSDWNDR